MFVTSSRRFLNRHFSPSYFFESSTGAENPAGDSPSQTPPSQTQPNPSDQSNSDAIVKGLADLLNSQRVGGDKDTALDVLYKKNVKLEDALDAARKSTLSSTDRATLDAAKGLLQSYGAKDFAELKTLIEDGKGAITERDTQKKTGSMRAAAEAAGLDFEDFASRKGVDDWSYEVKDENRDDKTVKVAYVTYTDAAGKEQTKSLADHAKAAFPTLTLASARQEAPRRGFVKQGVSGKTETTAERIRREEAERGQRRTGRAAVETEAGGARQIGPRRSIFDR
jgi:hypothetical protein